MPILATSQFLRPVQILLQYLTPLLFLQRRRLFYGCLLATAALPTEGYAATESEKVCFAYGYIMHSSNGNYSWGFPRFMLDVVAIASNADTVEPYEYVLTGGHNIKKPYKYEVEKLITKYVEAHHNEGTADRPEAKSMPIPDSGANVSQCLPTRAAAENDKQKVLNTYRDDNLFVIVHGDWFTQKLKTNPKLSKDEPTQYSGDKNTKKATTGSSPKLTLTRTGPSDEEVAKKQKQLDSQNTKQLAAEKARKEKEVLANNELRRLETKRLEDFKDSRQRHNCVYDTKFSESAYLFKDAQAKALKRIPPNGASGLTVLGDPYRVLRTEVACVQEKTDINPKIICIGKVKTEVSVIGACGDSQPTQGASK